MRIFRPGGVLSERRAGKQRRAGRAYQRHLANTIQLHLCLAVGSTIALRSAFLRFGAAFVAPDRIALLATVLAVAISATGTWLSVSAVGKRVPTSECKPLRNAPSADVAGEDMAAQQ